MAGLHLFLVVRQGVAPRAAELEKDAPPKTSDAEYPAYYVHQQHEAKSGGYRFWPDIIAKDVIMATVVIAFLVLLGTVVKTPLESPADPTDASYVPRPEWYFLPFFQLLKLVPGSLESAVAVRVPAAIVLVLLLLPLLDKKSVRTFRRRPGAAVTLGVAAIFTAILLGSPIRDEPKDVLAPEVGRILTSTERAGRTQFERQQYEGLVGAHRGFPYEWREGSLTVSTCKDPHNSAFAFFPDNFTESEPRDSSGPLKAQEKK